MYFANGELQIDMISRAPEFKFESTQNVANLRPLPLLSSSSDDDETEPTSEPAPKPCERHEPSKKHFTAIIH
jgi:hypothetical protein